MESINRYINNGAKPKSQMIRKNKIFKKMKKLLTLVFIALSINAISQSLEKYADGYKYGFKDKATKKIVIPAKYTSVLDFVDGINAVTESKLGSPNMVVEQKWKIIDTKLIIGSWKITNVVDKTGLNIKDKITFNKNDSLIIEINTIEKRFNQKFFGTYKIDSTTKKLSMSYKDTSNNQNINLAWTTDLIKLTETELELKSKSQKGIDRFVRY